MSNLVPYFESIIDSDECSIVICDLEHTIIYMNISATEEYSNLIGKSLFDCHGKKSNQKIIDVIEWFKKSSDNNKVHTYYNKEKNKDVYIIAIRTSDKKLIGYYEKHVLRTKDNTIFYDI